MTLVFEHSFFFTYMLHIAVEQQKLIEQLPFTLESTNLEKLFPPSSLYRGKVRDVYDLGEQKIIITTDRVSAYDRILGTIPFKGEILTQIAIKAFDNTKDILRNHILEVPDPNVIIAAKCQPYPVEFIVRAYITGSLWRDYLANKADAYGIEIPQNLKKDSILPIPILTPSTKATLGEHDLPISREEIINQGLLSAKQFDEAAEKAMLLFERGQSLARDKGLILVDTKYEFGEDANGQLVVIDEIHTPDSSRYWILDEYEQRFNNQQDQRMLDKENLRQWLREEKNFLGDGPAPELTPEIRCMLASRYIEVYNRLVGVEFKAQVGPVHERVEQHLGRFSLAKHTQIRKNL